MKFLTLLKKELRELLSLTTILTLIGSVVLLIAIGGVMDSAVEEAASSEGEIVICNKDDGAFSGAVIESLKTAGYEVKEVELTDGDYAPQLSDLEVESVVIIPASFSSSIADVLAGKLGEDGKIAPVDVEYVSKMTSLSAMSNVDAGSQMALSAIEAAVKSVVYANKNMSLAEIELIEAPVNLIETTVVGEKQAEASSMLLSSYSMMTGMIVPIVIFVLIVYSSQMIMNAVSTEKIDKTLETLLTAPVSRLSVLMAKMVAATVVSALFAVAFMVGFNNMMGGMTDMVSGEIDSAVISELGLNMSTGAYVLLGLQMFMSLLITLAVSLILGALAKDAKSSQTLMMPIMGMAMVPYMLSMFVSINDMGPAKWIMYAIPYTHTFIAQENVIFGNMPLYFGGLIYQAILLVICMTIAVRLFMSDKLFTITFNFGEKKNKYAKKKSLFSK